MNLAQSHKQVSLMDALSLYYIYHSSIYQQTALLSFSMDKYSVLFHWFVFNFTYSTVIA